MSVISHVLPNVDILTLQFMHTELNEKRDNMQFRSWYFIAYKAAIYQHISDKNIVMEINAKQGMRGNSFSKFFLCCGPCLLPPGVTMVAVQPSTQRST